MKKDNTLIGSTLPFAKENRMTSWFHTISTLFILLISQSMILLNIHWGINLLFSVFSGLVIVRMFIIYHDYLHGTIHRYSKIANGIFTLFGYYILAPKTVWKRSHDYHHNHNAKLYRTGIGSYPVFTKSRFETLSSKDQKQYLFIRNPWVILFGYYFTFFYGMCIQSITKSFKKHVDSLIAIFFHIALHTLIFVLFGWQTFIWFSLLPHFISGALGAYLFYAQHNFPGVHYEVDQNWTYESAALESSSFLNTSKFMHWVTGNIGYHHIHHLNSHIPFYRLPEAMKSVKEFQNPKTTTLKPKDIWDCLQLKLWDSESNEMIGFTKKWTDK